MKYYINRTVNTDFDQVVNLLKTSLNSEGFGVVTEVDLDKKIEEKLKIAFRRYKILGVCNPAFAYRALEQEDKIGTMLPCNIIIQELGKNEIEVAAVDPVASMMAIENRELDKIAGEIKQKLERVIKSFSVMI